MTVTFGSKYVFSSAVTSYVISATLLTSTSVFISYGLSGAGGGIVASINGSAISYGTVVNFASVSMAANNLCCTSLTSTSVFILYGSAANQITGIVASISGTTITYGTGVSSSTNYSGSTENLLTQSVSCVALTPGAVGCVYSNQYNSSLFYGIATISGTTVTLPTFTYTGVGIYSYVNMIKLPGSSTTALLAYLNNSTLGIISLNFNTGLGTSTTAASSTGNPFCFCLLSSSTGLFSWSNNALNFSTNGSAVNFGSGMPVLSGATDHTEISSIYMYNNGANSTTVYLTVSNGGTIDLSKTIWKGTIVGWGVSSITLANCPIIVPNGYSLYIYESGNASNLSQINLNFFGISVSA